MGFTKTFKGLGVYLNTILHARKDDKQANYIQAFMSDGEKPVNVMKTKGEHNCLAEIRNLPDDEPLLMRIEYHDKELFVLTYNYKKDDFDQCLTFEADLEFPGIWLITAGNGMKNPDHVFLESFALYNRDEKVAEGHNQHIHDAHKKKAERDMRQFDLTHKVTDLLHNEQRWFNKKSFGEENLIDMIPDQLLFTKNTMSAVLREMYNNLNYYYRLTDPLHTSKNYTEQVQLVMTIMKNLTFLASDMDGAKSELIAVEMNLHDEADNHLKETDKYLSMDTAEKSGLFEDAVAEFQTSLTLLKKKFDRIDKKVEDLGVMTDDLHLSTDKLEALFVRDIEKRKKYYQEHVLSVDTSKVTLDGV